MTVADTVGAGDSLAAGLLSGLLTAGVTTARGARGTCPTTRCSRSSTTPRWWPR